MNKVIIDESDDYDSQQNMDEDLIDIEQETCVVTVGSVDSGKSTFIGTLCTNQLDDGNYKLSKSVAKHPHEKESNKTSDISVRTIRKYEGKDVVMVDLCGHKKYLGTTIFGLTGHFPDYGALIIAANKGTLPPMAIEHLELLLCLEIPFCIIITREDIAPISIYKETLRSLKTFLEDKQKNVKFLTKSEKMMLSERKNDISKDVMGITFDQSYDIINKFVDDYCKGRCSFDRDCTLSLNDMNKVKDIFKKYITEYEKSLYDKIKSNADDMKANPYLVPGITISNKTGYCLELAKELIYNLKPRKDNWLETEDTVFYIDSSFYKPGIGVILSGILRGKPINVGDTMYIGPYGVDFIKIKIWSIHNNRRHEVQELHNAHRGCIAIRVLDKKVSISRVDIKKGMVVVSSQETTDNLCYEFESEVEILNHSTTITTGYSPNLQMGNSKQCARIVLPLDTNNKDLSGNVIEPTLKTGSVSIAKFRFLYRPEFVRTGDSFVFKEELTRGKGKVLNVLPLKNDTMGPAKPNRKPRTREFKTSNKKGTLSVK